MARNGYEAIRRLSSGSDDDPYGLGLMLK